MNERKELSEIQRFALVAAREKATEAQNFLNRIFDEILNELSIPKEDIRDWQFTDNFKYIEKKNQVIDPETSPHENKEETL